MRKIMPDICINQVEYSLALGGQGAIIHIFGRDTEGKAHRLDLTGFRPYFFIPHDQFDKGNLPLSINDVDSTYYCSIRGEAMRRLYTIRPGDVRDARKGYRHHEADIPFTTRFMIDTGMTGGISCPGGGARDYRSARPIQIDAPAKFCIVDIECDDSHGFPDATSEAVLCLTCYDSFDDDYITFALRAADVNQQEMLEPTIKSGGLVNGCFKPGKHAIIWSDTEQQMFAAFATYIKHRDPDILTGWNFVDFDMPYILTRMETLGMNTEGLARLPGTPDHDSLRGRALFDLLTAYKKMHQTKQPTYRLDAIAFTELGEQKVRYVGTLFDLWKKDPVKFIEYNFKDVELCVGINKKNNIVGFYREIARYVGCPLDRTLNSSSVVDVYVLRKAHGKYVLPSKGNDESKPFEGATVFEPSKGLRENVIVLDLKSLYPMAMMTINASMETKDPNGEIVAPSGIHFRKSPDGITRSLIMDLLKERDEKKRLRNTFAFGSNEYEIYDMQQNVVKVIMNTYYGVSGYNRFRLYDPDIGASVTSVGRAIIEHTRKVVEAQGHKVIYGDSVGKDSLIRIYRGTRFCTTTISKLFECSKENDVETDDSGKERIRLKNVYTDTVDSNGNIVVRRVPYIMRHKIIKKMYRMDLGHDWHVDVTEDHSLICYSISKSASEAFSSPVFFEAKPSDAISNYLVTRQGSCFEIVRPVSVVEIPYDDYVYDIEVEGTHRFFANNILVHNTDSCMVQIPATNSREETIAIARGLEKILNESYPVFAKEVLNADVSYFSIKFEKIYSRFFQSGRKKRYAGILAWKEGKDVNETDIVGFEMKRSDTCAIAKKAMSDVMDMILNGNDYEDVRKYLHDVIRKYRKREYSLEEIGIPGGIGKGLDEYEHPDAQVRGAIYSNTFLGTNFARGSKPKRLYISAVTGKYPATDVICFEYSDTVPKEFIIDTELMLEKTLKSPLTRIVESLGWDWESFDPSIKTLSDFGF